MTIYFYAAREQPYGCFSNFSVHGFMLDKLYWPTCEHYFQAQKFINTPYVEKVRQTKTPKDAANLGRSRSLPLRSDWEQVKDNMMQKGVLQKFKTHGDIREILLATGDELLMETSPIDYYWGCVDIRPGVNARGFHLFQQIENR